MRRPHKRVYEQSKLQKSFIIYDHLFENYIPQGSGIMEQIQIRLD